MNLTLEIYLKSRNEMHEPRHVDRASMYSGETIAGIVFGILVIVLLVFLFVILVVMRYKESMIPSSLQRSTCLGKCLLDGRSHQQHRDHHQDQQAVDRHNNKIGIIENPGATRNTTSSSDGRRENGLSGMTHGSKYGSFDVISMMTANNQKTISSQQRQQQDIDSGHEEGSYESRVSIVTSGRSLISSGIIREDSVDDGTGMTRKSNDQGSRTRDEEEQQEEEESLQRPKVKALQVQGKEKRETMGHKSEKGSQRKGLQGETDEKRESETERGRERKQSDVESPRESCVSNDRFPFLPSLSFHSSLSRATLPPL